MPSNYDSPYVDEDLQYGRLLGNLLNPPTDADPENSAGRPPNYMGAMKATAPAADPVASTAPAAPAAVSKPAQSAPQVEVTPALSPAAAANPPSLDSPNRRGGLSQKLPDYFDRSTKGQFDALDNSRKALQDVNSAPLASTANAPLEAQRATLAQPLDPNQKQYKPGIGTRIVRGVRGALTGLMQGGVLGAVANTLPNEGGGIGTNYRAPNRQWSQDSATRAMQVAGLDAQMKQNLENEGADTKRGTELATAQKGIATGYNDLNKGLNEQGKLEQGITDPLKKFEVLTGGDGKLYQLRQDGTAFPINGPDGKPLMGDKKLTYQTVVGPDGKPHTYGLDERGNKVSDLGVHYEKPTVSVNTGNKELDSLGARLSKPFQSGLTSAQAQLEKIDEANSMISGSAEAQALGIPKVLTALVSGQGSGVRITQAELNAIAHARGIQGDVEGFFNKLNGQGHLSGQQVQQLKGVLADAKQRIMQKVQIHNDAIDAINGASSRDEIMKAEKEARQKLTGLETGNSESSPSSGRGGNAHHVGPSEGTVENGYRFKGGDPAKQSNWEKVSK